MMNEILFPFHSRKRFAFFFPLAQPMQDSGFLSSFAPAGTWIYTKDKKLHMFLECRPIDKCQRAGIFCSREFCTNGNLIHVEFF